MIILAAESSTLLGSVALLKDGKLIGYTEAIRQGSHSDVINLFIEKILKENNLSLKDVDVFAAGIGPGSFTGIRISLNTIKTLAYCHEKMTIGINSLENIAWLNYLKNPGIIDVPIVAMINAYKNMVYVATYRKVSDKIICENPPEVVRVQCLEEYIQQPSYLVGDGFAAYQKYFSIPLKEKQLRPVCPQDEPNAYILGEIAFSNIDKLKHWSELLPLYLRASEAEENLKGIRYQALI